MELGTLIRKQGGFYYVLTSGLLWECRLRGRFRIKDGDIFPGDRVNLRPVGGHSGVVEEVLPRKNLLKRPAVANVDQVVVVMSLADPAPNWGLLDRMTVMAESHGLQVIICLNKVDLATALECRSALAAYRETGYRLHETSVITGSGIRELREAFQGVTSVMSGPSGVGKSSLLNAVQRGFKLQTGTVSEKTRHGRHTTRYVELLKLGDSGLVADTPGFSSLEVPDVKRGEVAGLFPEMLPFEGKCRFYDCLHRDEPDCAVKLALEEGKINRKRYANYLDILQEVISRERRY